jgi:two-component system response regulator QseB
LADTESTDKPFISHPGDTVRTFHVAPTPTAVRQTEEHALHIILVEDDVQLGAAIQRALERLTYTVTWLKDGRQALNALRDETADLVLLDLGLPGKDGLEVLVEARRNNIKTPVLVMTARDNLEARVAGLDAGADDYLVKPFHLDELGARIRSLTRRMQGLAANRIEAGVLSLDLGTSEVTFRGDRIDLTRREFSLLQTLMERAGRLVRRESLENSLYGLDNAVGSSALEVLVHALRRKLSFETIQNVRGFGYMIPREPK